MVTAPTRRFIWILRRGKTLAEVLRFSLYETHPPLTYILYHYWLMLFSDPTYVRSLSLVFGLMLIPIYYAIGNRLDGALTGMLCAALIAFSLGCIIQSFVVRQYIFFLFFASLGYYCYLQWRREKNALLLSAYGLCEALACFTHFSGIFIVACMVLYHALEERRRNGAIPWGDKGWCLVNLLVIAFGFFLYSQWRATMQAQTIYYINLAPDLKTSLSLAFAYPLMVLSYDMPCYFAAIAVVALLLAFAFCPSYASAKEEGLRSCMNLAWITLAFGIMLTVTHVYPFPGTRHSLWTLPLLLPSVAWIFAEACGFLRLMMPRSWQHISAAVIFAAGIMTYSPAIRFSENLEYEITTRQWDAVAPFLASLGPEDLIVAQKEDAILLQNLYPYLGDAPFTGTPMAALAPYRNTHILFNPANRILNHEHMLTVMLQEAEKTPVFASIHRVVFMRAGVVTSVPIFNIMRCPLLAGKAFIPPNPRSSPNVLFMTIPASTLLNDVLPPAGKAHSCLEMP